MIGFQRSYDVSVIVDAADKARTGTAGMFRRRKHFTVDRRMHRRGGGGELPRNFHPESPTPERPNPSPMNTGTKTLFDILQLQATTCFHQAGVPKGFSNPLL